MARKRIGEILIEAGVIDETRLRAALIEQQRWGGPLGRLLVEMKIVDETSMVHALSRQLAVPAVDLDAQAIPAAVIALVPGELCEQHSLVPFATQMKFLDVAMADPTNSGILDELQIRTHLNVRPHLAGPKAIERAIGRYYQRGFNLAARSGSIQSRGPEIDIDPPGPPGLENEVEALQARVSKLETLQARDEDVLRKVLGLLVEKGVARREDILARIKGERPPRGAAVVIGGVR
jgi:type IV pilus assembly protein PilB